MATNQNDSETRAVSPDQLLVTFSRGRILFWMGIAVLIHVVVIGGTSVGYIRDRWIDPEGAKLRREAAAAALAAEKAKAQAAARPAAPQAASSNAVAVATNAPASGAPTNAPAATNAAAATPAAGDEASELAAHKNTTVVKRITEAASTNEIPKKPELGISLEDTNPR